MNKGIIFIFLFTLSFSAFAFTWLISWTDPTKREDGTVLTTDEIAGFKTYYGTSPGDYQFETELMTTRFWTISPYEYPPGTKFYTVVTTIDTDGRESVYSDEVVIYIDENITWLQKIRYLWVAGIEWSWSLYYE